MTFLNLRWKAAPDGGSRQPGLVASNRPVRLPWVVVAVAAAHSRYRAVLLAEMAHFAPAPGIERLQWMAVIVAPSEKAQRRL